MEIKDQKMIDTLAETLGVQNLSGIKILSPKEHAAELKKMAVSYFQENFLKRIDDEMNKATKLKDSKQLLLILSELRQKAISLKENPPQIGLLFELAEQLGAIGYSIFVADKIETDWIDFINLKKK